MDFERAVEKIVSRVKASKTPALLSYDEINEWLKLSSGDDLIWAYDKLSERLTTDHSICLELREDCVTAVSG